MEALLIILMLILPLSAYCSAYCFIWWRRPSHLYCCLVDYSLREPFEDKSGNFNNKTGTDQQDKSQNTIDAEIIEDYSSHHEEKE